jgi:glycosyltransferase involved in cell wall biosynthesis
MLTISWEIVLVGNYWPQTEDKTPEIVKTLSEKLPNVRYIAHPKEGAMGWDMKAGLDACQGEYIGVTDGDGQFPLEIILASFARIKSGNFDLVKTYRAQRDDGLWRNVISYIYNLLFTVLFPKYRGLHDVNGKPKIIKKQAYEKMNLVSTDWFLDAEIMLKALELDLKIEEMPTKFLTLTERPSFIKFNAVIEFIGNLFAYRFKYGKFRGR